MNAPPPSSAAPGVDAGKYRRILLLGRGGMATVYLAALRSHQGFTKLVVIKDLRPEFADVRTFQEMFAEEGRIAARLSHPNVVQTFEVHADDDRSMSLVMEYLEGQSLATLQKTFGPKLPLAAHLRILVEVLEGLHYAHELRDFDGRPFGLVHRDVSPQNVFVTYEGEVKVLDFGIAKAATASEVVTEAGDIKGKLPYMAPEQALARPLDRRADVFAMGVMLWEALAGVRLWHGHGNASILLHLANGSLPRLDAPPGVDPALVAIAAKALSPDVDQRYRDCRALRDALEPFVAGVDRRQLGRIVSEQFAAQRQQITAQIEAQLRLAEASKTGEFNPIRLATGESSASGLRSRTGSSAMRSVPGHTGSSSGVLSTAMPVHPSPPPAPRGQSVIVAIAVVGLLILLGGGALMAQRVLAVRPPPTMESGGRVDTATGANPLSSTAVVATPGTSSARSSAEDGRDASPTARPNVHGKPPPQVPTARATGKATAAPDNDLGY